jgi:hypothetical protein
VADERQTFKWGGTTFPLTQSTAQSLLQDVDPARYWALQFFKRVLELHIGDRWAIAAAAAGLAGEQLNIVASAVPYDPLPSLRTEQFTFPLLSVFRLNGKTDEQTLTWERTTSEWGITFSLPPLKASQREQLEPVLKVVADVLKNRTTLGYDPNFENGAQVWSDAYSGVTEIGFTAERFGNMAGAENVFFPTLLMTMYTVEQERPVNGAYDAMEGTDNAIPLEAADGTTTGFNVDVDVNA